MSREIPTDGTASTPTASIGEKSPEMDALEATPTMDFPDGGLRAWLAVAGTSSVLFCTFGYINSFGVFAAYYLTHQLSDKSPTQIAWIGSLQVFFLFGSGAFAGPLFDRYGALVVFPPAVLYVVSVMMTSLCTEYYQFILAQGVLGGICCGFLMTPSMTAVQQYFNKKRGAALGLSVAGSSLGGVIFPIAVQKMLTNPSLGFGWTVRISGFIMLALLAVSIAGVRPRLPPRKDQMFLFGAFKSKLYLMIIAALFLMIWGFFTPFFFLPSYAIQKGMDEDLTSYIVSILNAASFFGRVLPGILSDKLGRLNMVCAAGMSSGILILCWIRIETSAAIIVFSALYGFCSGAIISLMSACVAMAAPKPNVIGTYLGMAMLVLSIAGLTGSPIGGALVDGEDYLKAQIFSGVVVIIGAAVVFLAKIFTPQGLFGNV